MRFGTHDVQAVESDRLFTRYRIAFPNGRGASIVTGFGAYADDEHPWEVAVLSKQGDLDYDTPITCDVVGHLDEAGVAEILDRIAALPEAT